jgi:hypothetical protein
VLVGRRADAGDAVQAVQQLLERAQPLRDLGADLLDEQIELVDVRQLAAPPGNAGDLRIARAVPAP